MSLLKRIWSTMPVPFPFIGLFHFMMLGFSIWNYSTEPFPSIGWLQPLWMLFFSMCWLFICDARKWAAYGYLFLTTMNIVLKLVLTTKTLRNDYCDPLFPADLLFSFFVLFYFPKFR